jgi:hypothetical protein
LILKLKENINKKMPNWFIGSLTIDTQGNNIDVLEDALDKIREDPHLGLEILDPIPDGLEEDNVDHQYHWWGTKWGMCNMEEDSWSHSPKGYYNFQYESPWNMPKILFKHLEDKYDWILQSKGTEDGQGFVDFYENGEYGTLDYPTTQEMVEEGFLDKKYLNKDGEFDEENEDFCDWEEARNEMIDTWTMSSVVDKEQVIPVECIGKNMIGLGIDHQIINALCT